MWPEGLGIGITQRIADWVAKQSLVRDCNVKAIPLQPWTGSEGSSRLRLPDIKTIGT